MGVMTRQTPAREIAPGLCGLGGRSRLALRQAQGFRKLSGQFLQAGWQVGFRGSSGGQRMCHGAVNRAMRQRFQDAKGPRNHARCKGLP